MKIITFSGVDGAGKSTQLERLRSLLEGRGKRIAYLHTVAFSLPQTARALFARENKKTSPGLARTKSGWLGIWLRKLILFIDLLRFHLFLRRLEKAGTDYLLSDRYFYDSLVNIAYLEGTALHTPSARLAARFIPRPAQAYYLKVTPEKVMERVRKPEQGLQYLKDKTLLFDEAATLWSFTVLDADQMTEAVFTTVAQNL